MRLMSLSRVMICPQCGDDWADARRRLEYCPRCGSPVAGMGYDPLRTQLHTGRLVRVNRGAKLVVRSGVIGIGLVCLLTGTLLFHAGWLSPDANMDVVQLWISRFSGPLLLFQGLAYTFLPFRRPEAAKVIPFPKRPRL
jgi:hypothetical protein